MIRIISLSNFDNMDNINDSDNFDDFFENLGYRFDESFSDGWDRLTQSIKDLYNRTTDKLEDELALPLTQTYVNDALKTYVTDNVKAILELRVEIHEDWFRLYCTVDAGGIYAEVASNFRLVHAQLDRNVQRFVFGQLTYTDILNLRCESFLKRQGIKLFIWFYHRILKKDPLGFILSYINIARTKNEIIYIDINRWLKSNKKIISTLHKAQINYGELEEEQLILKAQINYRDLLSSNSNEDIISEKDEPVQVQGPVHPLDAEKMPRPA
ncbi:hypothetical protein Psyc_0598 [Psychrobacter arcticus 273-4]|uniref:Uncharacterized protein n=1 Tax=Psychrobacter arcticus (strain DSM 17307 / VKM B-2377 / 273-4) TaxID=259536 RepID=Q4FU50_PSYA2|nr:hypothetical protein [Psychrobacter arcticus]AAZ18458.1 hypothetical protein Psyc_0598 [Psychrobacter arcticus 273-4]